MKLYHKSLYQTLDFYHKHSGSSDNILLVNEGLNLREK
jgi:hypothetical protein